MSPEDGVCRHGCSSSFAMRDFIPTVIRSCSLTSFLYLFSHTLSLNHDSSQHKECKHTYIPHQLLDSAPKMGVHFY